MTRTIRRASIIRGLIIFVIPALIGCSSARAAGLMPDPEPSAESYQVPDTSGPVAFVGDSLANGMGRATAGALNGGIVGAGLSVGQPTSNAAHWRLSSERAGMTLIEIGTNDFGYAGGSRYGDLLSKFILPLAPKPTLCIVLPPIPEKLSIRDGVIARGRTIQEWALAHGLRVVEPLFPPGQRARDGIHFTAAGYRAMADNAIAACRNYHIGVDASPT